MNTAEGPNQDPIWSYNLKMVLMTVLEGETKHYGVRLQSQPLFAVTVTTVIDTDAGTIAFASRPKLAIFPHKLTFTNNNWYKPQVMQVSNEDDEQQHKSPAKFTVTQTCTSSDKFYNADQDGYEEKNTVTAKISVYEQDTAAVTLASSFRRSASGRSLHRSRASDDLFRV